MALNRFANVPPKTAFHPSLAISCFLFGAIPPIPPISIAIEEILANPHNANTIVFNRGMSMAKMIGSSARTSKVYTYMKDHYLYLVIVAKDYDDNGARGSGVMMVSKQDNSNDVLLTLYKGPDLSTSKLEKVIGAMLSTNFKR